MGHSSEIDSHRHCSQCRRNNPRRQHTIQQNIHSQTSSRNSYRHLTKNTKSSIKQEILHAFILDAFFTRACYITRYFYCHLIVSSGLIREQVISPVLPAHSQVTDVFEWCFTHFFCEIRLRLKNRQTKLEQILAAEKRVWQRLLLFSGTKIAVFLYARK